MPPVPVPSAGPHERANKRLAGGLLLSLLVHALVLSIQFGLPDFAPGNRAPLTVTLAPPLPVAPPPAPVPALPAAPLPDPAPAPAATAPPALAAPSVGMRLVDPVAPPAPAVPAPVPAPAPRPRKKTAPRKIGRPRARGAAEEERLRVIAQEPNPDASFVVPLPQAGEVAVGQPQQAEADAARQAELESAENEQQRLAQQQADDERRIAEETAQRQALAQLQRREDEARRMAVQEQERQLQQRQADEAESRLRAQQLADAQNRLLNQRAAEEAAARQQAEELARQQAQQLAARQQAEDAARQQAQQLAARQQAEEVARQQAQQLAARQQAEELARQQAYQQAVRQRADEALRQQAEQAERGRRDGAAQQLAASPAPATTGDAGAGGVAAGNRPGPGAGSGSGSVPLPKNMLGSDIGNRARDMMRGIDVLRPLPPAARPAEDALRSRRRADADAAQREVPLRMYIDSFRQKIERNGALAAVSLAADRVRIDPLVSVTLRSDGSVDDVTIVRSSGRPETDEAVRRLVRLNARYSAFPPNVAALYDVIEIRRIWSFAEGIKLREEVR